MASPSTPARIRHAENFPVASWLCPRRLRPPIRAIYHFARTADDLADEGSSPAHERLAALQRYRHALAACLAGQPPDADEWPEIFGPLAAQIAAFGLPAQPFHDLLSAFMQDVEKTRDGAGYADLGELLDYCQRSANPVGRLLLHLHGADDPHTLQQGDAICSALQLINFWQDLSVDRPRGRHYLPRASCMAHGIPTAFAIGASVPLPAAAALSALVLDLAAHARSTMAQGAALVHRLPGRASWELRAVVQGGLRVLDRIERLRGRVFHERPHLGLGDFPSVAWRTLRM